MGTIERFKATVLLLWTVAAWQGCSESPDLQAISDGGEAVSVVFPEPAAAPFGYGETRTVEVVVKGASETVAEGPSGWKAALEGSRLTVTAPAAQDSGFELSGNVTVTARNERGVERSADLRVFIGEWEPYVEFSEPVQAPFDYGETRSLEVASRDVSRAETTGPRGWTVRWDGREVAVTAPQSSGVGNDKNGTVTLTAYSESGLYSWTARTEVRLSDGPEVNLNEGGRYANCYVVSLPGTSYCFDPTVMGNGEEGLSEELKAKLAEHGNEVLSAALPEAKGAVLLWESEQGIVGDVKLSDEGRRLSFRTREGAFAPGNASVAAVDAEGGVIWSWHIWITDKPSEQRYSNGKVMLDRDLGAVSTVPADYGAVGLMYEWGRKDPFPPGCDIVAGNADRPEDTEVFVQDNSRRMFTHADHPFRTVYTDATVGTIEYAVRNPTDYICTVPMTGGGDWYHGSSGMLETDRNPCLWGNPEGYLRDGDGGFRKGKKSIYDPCPPGYRVPDADAYTVFCKRGAEGGEYEEGIYNIHGTPDDYSAGSDYRGRTGSHWIVGLNFIYDEAGNYSWYPAVGSRVSETGRLTGGGMNIFHWTNSPYMDSPRHSYYLWGSKNYLYPMRDGGDRAYAYAVRCMKDE